VNRKKVNNAGRAAPKATAIGAALLKIFHRVKAPFEALLKKTAEIKAEIKVTRAGNYFISPSITGTVIDMSPWVV
jgi:hypothetical protein